MNARTLLPRAARLLASLAVALACIWAAKWFALQAARPIPGQAPHLDAHLPTSHSDTAGHTPGTSRERPAFPTTIASVPRASQAPSHTPPEAHPVADLINALLAAAAGSRPAAHDPAGATPNHEQPPEDVELFLSLLAPAGTARRSVDPGVPLPHDAEPLLSLAAARDDDVLAVYRSSISIADLAAFFRREMHAAGWVPADPGPAGTPGRVLLRFERPQRTCLLLCIREQRGAGTLVVVRTLTAQSETP